MTLLLVCYFTYLFTDVLSYLFIVLFDLLISFYLFSWGGEMVSGKYVGTRCLHVGFWRLIWRTEPLDRGLILVCRFSFVSSRECAPVAARSCLQGWMHVRNPLLLPNG
jgi:hypothetical protein